MSISVKELQDISYNESYKKRTPFMNNEDHCIAQDYISYLDDILMFTAHLGQTCYITTLDNIFNYVYYKVTNDYKENSRLPRTRTIILYVLNYYVNLGFDVEIFDDDNVCISWEDC